MTKVLIASTSMRSLDETAQVAVELIPLEISQRYRASSTRLVVVLKVPSVGSRAASLPHPPKATSQDPLLPQRRKSNSRKKKKGDRPAACCVLVATVDPEATREGEPSCVARPSFAAAARKGKPNSSDRWAAGNTKPRKESSSATTLLRDQMGSW